MEVEGSQDYPGWAESISRLWSSVYDVHSCQRYKIVFCAILSRYKASMYFEISIANIDLSLGLPICEKRLDERPFGLRHGRRGWPNPYAPET